MRSRLLLTILTLTFLLPFSQKAFHMDDPLFLWTAQHVMQHPLDPYGFRVVWYATEQPIADITKNPALASYFIAAVASLFGWSERALRLAFLLPALAVVLGTHQLARRFTRFPFFAAAAVLAAPGFLVSSTTVMCDVLMLALWVLAVLFWVEGLESHSHWRLVLAAMLVAACALTKYFGIALLPLLLFYTWLKGRKWDAAVGFLVIPVAVLAIYQVWTRNLYGRGLLSDAVQYASFHNRGHELSLLAKLLVGLAFAGGCALPALLLAPLLWRMWSFAGLAVSLIVALAVAGHQPWFDAALASAHWTSISIQLAVFVLGGLSILALAVSRELLVVDTDAALLSAWLLGTFLFAAFVNWTVNARSILPLIPAAAILLAQRLELRGLFERRRTAWLAATGLGLSSIVSLWVAAADERLANAGRIAASQIHQELGANSDATVYFEGHWGFQFYMQQVGARPADLRNSPFRLGDILIIPENATNTFGPPPGFDLPGRLATIELHSRAVTMSQPLGAGFYASVWGPLPFAIGEAQPERYWIGRLSRQLNHNQ